MHLLEQFRSFERPVQVLLLNQLTISIGFFMLVPFLAAYLSQDLALAGWMVGLVLGVRNMSQQGLFLVGGTLADRVGYRPVIIAGCALRTVGFALFGLAASLPGLLVAALLSGFAGALFSPAVRAYLAAEAGERRVEAFALFNVFQQAGLLLGPLIGVALLGFDFRVVCLLAAGLFFLLTVVQVHLLPARPGSEAQSTQTVLADWQEVIANRAFVLFAIATLGHYTLFTQFYFSLPLEIRRLTGGDAGVGVMFALSAGLGVLAQWRVTAFSVRRWRPSQAIAVGLTLMGAAFAPELASAGLLPLTPQSLQDLLPGLVGLDWSAPQARLLLDLINLSPVLISASLLSLGIMVSLPFAMDMIPTLSAGRLVGTYYGLYYVISGLGTTLGNLAIGIAFDAGQGLGFGGLPWMLLVTLGGASAAAVLALDRSGMLAGRAEATAVGKAFDPTAGSLRPGG